MTCKRRKESGVGSLFFAHPLSQAFASAVVRADARSIPAPDSQPLQRRADELPAHCHAGLLQHARQSKIVEAESPVGR